MTINATSFQFAVFSITTPGTAEQLTAFIIPDGLEAVVMARATNADVMHIADTKANAEGTAKKTLVPGQSVHLQIDDTSKIWFDAATTSEVLELTVQRIPSTGG